GIGQYISVTLSKGSTSTALKARIASGDFNGGRTFPVGTPVVVVSYKGSMEVFLGNLPFRCDLFNGSTDPNHGGWNGSKYSELGWLTDAEMIEAPFGPDPGPTIPYDAWMA